MRSLKAAFCSCVIFFYKFWFASCIKGVLRSGEELITTATSIELNCKCYTQLLPPMAKCIKIY